MYFAAPEVEALRNEIFTFCRSELRIVGYDCNEVEINKLIIRLCCHVGNISSVGYLLSIKGPKQRLNGASTVGKL